MSATRTVRSTRALPSVKNPSAGPRPPARRSSRSRSPSHWWALSQDQRRAIFEETSHHIATGVEYLPAVARRLHHGRDLGESFRFLTWFEFSPEDAAGFDELVGRLRATGEWSYVTRAVDIRLKRG